MKPPFLFELDLTTYVSPHHEGGQSPSYLPSSIAYIILIQHQSRLGLFYKGMLSTEIGR